MESARTIFLDALRQEKPLILLLGQAAYSEPDGSDIVLSKSLDRLKRAERVDRGWPALLDAVSVPESFFDWLAERFERRVPPAPVEILREVPWSAVFTSALDPTIAKLLAGQGRQPEVVLTANELPRAPRSKARPPIYYLFSRAGISDAAASPPKNRSEFNTRRISHALPLLGRLKDTATSLGLILVDGFSADRDWLTIQDILGAIGNLGLHQVIWCGGAPRGLRPDDADDFDRAVATGQIIIEPERLGTVVAQLRVLDHLPSLSAIESEDAGFVSLGNGKRLETTPEQRLKVEAAASIVDDAWTAFLPPLGQDAEYVAFRRFHGDMGGARLLVEGVRRKFSIERNFEIDLHRSVEAALADHASVKTPIVVHGQSGTGKSIAIARIVVAVRERKIAPVLYSIGRVPRSQEVSAFCEAAETAGADVTLIVCDANREIEVYRELLLSLRSRGRRVVVLGSTYRTSDAKAPANRWRVEALTKLIGAEQSQLADLLERFVGERPAPHTFSDTHILGFLYRFLPASRPRLSEGLSAEARTAEAQIRVRGRHKRAPLPDTVLARKLLEAGANIDYRAIFTDDESDALEAKEQDAAGRLIDLVMVAGAINCPVPVNLLLRAVTDTIPDIDFSVVGEIFGGLDLFRWKWADKEQSELLVLPRIALEADLICRRRLAGPTNEAARLIDLIKATRSGSIEGEH